MNKEAIFGAVDGFIEAVCNEQTACAESILDAVGELPDDKERATQQVVWCIKQAGVDGNLKRCLGETAVEELAREVVFQHRLATKAQA